VTLDGEPVNVLFAGLTPGLASLYQIDLQVPSDAKDGDLILQISQTGTPSNAGILPVHHLGYQPPMVMGMSVNQFCYSAVTVPRHR
jgi:hypothetical protein